jgi:WD40 repeat protein
LALPSKSHPARQGVLAIILALLSQSILKPAQAENPQIALQAGHYGNVAAAAFSPDGRTIATGGDDWNVKLWDSITGEVKRTLIGHTASVTRVLFSPNGKILASGGYDSSLRLWDTTTWVAQVTLADPERNVVTALAFSPDQKLLASGVGSGGEFRGKIRLWDLHKKALKLTIDEGSEGITGVIFSSDSKAVVSSSKDGKLKLWNANTGALEKQIEAHTNEVTSLAISRDRKAIASASLDGSIKLWDASTVTLKRTIAGENDTKNHAEFSPDGKQLLVGNSDVKIFDSTTGDLVRTLEKKTLSSAAVSFSPDGKLIFNIGVAAGEDAPSTEVHLWNAQAGNFNRKLNGYTAGVVSVLFSPDSSNLIVGDSYKRLAIWSLRTGELVKTIPQPADLKSIALSPDGKSLATGGGNFGEPGFLSLWDQQSGNLIRTFTGFLLPVRATGFSPDGRILAASSEDGTVSLWNIETGGSEKTLKVDNLPVHALIFTRDGRSIITGSLDGKVREWDVATGTIRNTLQGQTSGVFSLALSADGILLASGGPNTSSISLWELPAGTLKTTIRDPLLSPTSMVFTSNSRLVVSNANGRVSLCDLDNAKIDRDITVHELNASAIAISGNGEYLASGSHDNSIRLLNPRKNRLIAILNSPRPEDISQIPPATKSTVAGASKEYFCITVDGFYTASAIAELAVRLRTGDQIFPAKRFHAHYYRPIQVRKALGLQ